LTSEPGIGECRRYISVASVEVTGDDGTNGPVRREVVVDRTFHEAPVGQN